ncbi:FG-GAP and VCBS repeat-containing protein [Horticoccus sp. 23ND18S-11]|uniref:FG-GAP and VCBS repeat-containing protein n=1 Tax=Horticoccus sp. 23ND18S-11 TaxID=3391832 RepID=UPI0039C9042A
MSLPRLILVTALATSTLVAAERPALKMRPQTIDPAIQIGYGLAIADVDGDKLDDILLADAKQIVWYRAPKWEKFVMAENLTAKDNVCIAARDVDGDGKAEVAVGAEWNPADTLNSGAVFFLMAPADRTQRWTPKKLPHMPTTHRMHWVRGADRSFYLAVLPLHGRGNKNGAGDGVQLHGYEWPWRETSRPFLLAADLPPLHLTHNFDLISGQGPQAAEGMLVATKEGLRSIEAPANRSVPASVTTIAAGEVRRGALPGGGRYVATIEPMHGHELAVYRGPTTQFSSGADWTAQRTSVDDKLVQGHGLATGDLLGIGSDQIVVGWRGGTPGAKVGIKVYAAADARGEAWELVALVDDNKMACEDLKVADLNGDGRPEIIAAGRATKNVIIYWNETEKSAR